MQVSKNYVKNYVKISKNYGPIKICNHIDIYDHL
jgi:hypothetical protein